MIVSVDVQPKYGEFCDLTVLTDRMCISKRTIRCLVQQPDNPLPAYRVGGKLLFRWQEVETWVGRHRVHAVDVESLADEIVDGICRT